MKTNAKIKVQSENIFPIIKKWLYSDHDIFARELVSNACDAITKFKKLLSVGEVKLDVEPEYAVNITVGKKGKYIIFEDNGIGMTADELDKYINEVAFSGAEEFLSKYKGDGAGIIGHFGLGFYSAFMVADKVTIETLSYIDGAKAVKWTCGGNTDVVMEDCERDGRGTKVTLFLADDSKEFADRRRLETVLNKYCAYLPYTINLIDADEKPAKKDKKDKDKAETETPETPSNVRKINKTPLWTKAVKDCTDEEYKSFYREMFADFTDPLFWIHLNVDYPFNLKGILYFPAIDLRNVKNEGAIKLFNNQVYVADNIKDVIPEYLMLLRGVLDCPDLPLNVSRSFLQNDGYLNKIKAHITKKVSEKLKNLCANEQENYRKYWATINPFVKYGCMTDNDFYGKIKEAVIFKTVKRETLNVKSEGCCCEGDKHDGGECHCEKRSDAAISNGQFISLPDVLKEKTVYYVNDSADMSLYLENFADKTVLLLDDPIDTHFIQFLESENKDSKFVRVDSDAALLGGKDEGGVERADIEKITDAFKRVYPDMKTEAGNLKLDLPCVIITGENARRMEAMGRIYGMGQSAAFKDEKLIVNAAHPLIKKLAESPDDETVKLLYGLARLGNNTMEPAAINDFVKLILKKI